MASTGRRNAPRRARAATPNRTAEASIRSPGGHVEAKGGPPAFADSCDDERRPGAVRGLPFGAIARLMAHDAARSPPQVAIGLCESPAGPRRQPALYRHQWGARPQAPAHDPSPRMPSRPRAARCHTLPFPFAAFEAERDRQEQAVTAARAKTAGTEEGRTAVETELAAALADLDHARDRVAELERRPTDAEARLEAQREAAAAERRDAAARERALEDRIAEGERRREAERAAAAEERARLQAQTDALQGRLAAETERHRRKAEGLRRASDRLDKRQPD